MKDDFCIEEEYEECLKEIEDLKEQVEYQDLWRKEYLSRIDKATNYIKHTKLWK